MYSLPPSPHTYTSLIVVLMSVLWKSPFPFSGEKDGKEDEADDDDAASMEPIPEDEDVAGVVFSRLIQREPDHAKELKKLRSKLIKETESAASTNMKVSR